MFVSLQFVNLNIAIHFGSLSFRHYTKKLNKQHNHITQPAAAAYFRAHSISNNNVYVENVLIWSELKDNLMSMKQNDMCNYKQIEVERNLNHKLIN